MTMETKTTNNEVQDALDYVRRELGADKLAVVLAQRKVQWCQRQPITTDYDDEIHDLLNEWGETQGLPEDWWDFDDVDFEDILEMI